VLENLPEEQGTIGSEQTTSIRCRDSASPATLQYGNFVSTAAWDVVLLRIACTIPQKVIQQK